VAASEALVAKIVDNGPLQRYRDRLEGEDIWLNDPSKDH
jgi:hypothetical protein